MDILIRDMPIYSSKFFNQLIEPSWKLLVLELSIYTENVIFSGEIEYTEDEKYKMEDENHLYTRGYESDDEDEKYIFVFFFKCYNFFVLLSFLFYFLFCLCSQNSKTERERELII